MVWAVGFLHGSYLAGVGWRLSYPMSLFSTCTEEGRSGTANPVAARPESVHLRAPARPVPVSLSLSPDRAPVVVVMDDDDDVVVATTHATVSSEILLQPSSLGRMHECLLVPPNRPSRVPGLTLTYIRPALARGWN